MTRIQKEKNEARIWELRKLGLVPNTLVELLDLFPERGWDYSLLSSNPNIDLAYILAHPDKDWNKIAVIMSDKISFKDRHLLHTKDQITEVVGTAWSCNSSITDKDVVDNPEIPSGLLGSRDADPARIGFPWNWNGLCCNRSLSLNFLIINLDKYNFGWGQLCKHPQFTLEHAIKYKDNDLCWISISSHPNITLQHILDHSELPSESLDSRDANPVRICLPWDWHSVCANPNITAKDIDNHPELPWDTEGYSSNDNVTVNDIATHLNWVWDSFNFITHPNISIEDIVDHPEIPWTFEDNHLTDNPRLSNVNIDDILCTGSSKKYKRILDFINKSWNRSNDSIVNEIEDYCKFHKKLAESWFRLSHNPSVDPEFTVNQKDKPWSTKYLSLNPNLTVEFIKNHPEIKFLWSVMSGNKFELNKIVAARICRKYKDLPKSSEFKKELLTNFNHLSYKEGGSGYQEAEKDWHDLSRS